MTVFTGKVEMGQNIRTSLSQQVAEELRVSVDAIRMVMGDTDLCPVGRGDLRQPYDADHGTAASRRRGHRARGARRPRRPALEGLARRARRRKRQDRQRRSEAVALLRRAHARRKARQDAARRHRGRRRFSRGEMEDRRHAGPQGRRPRFRHRSAQVPVRHVPPRNAPRQDPPPDRLRGDAPLARCRQGRGHARRQGRARRRLHRRRRSGPLYGRAGGRRARLGSEVEGNPRPALQRDHLRIPQEERRRRRSERSEPRITGSVDQGLASADVKLSQTYTVQYIAHAPLEPRAAVAEWNGDKLTVWTGSQRPFAVREELATRVSHAGRERARPHPRHRLRLRRQAHRRRGGRGRATVQGSRQARQGRLDARGGIHLGVPAPGRRHRGAGRSAQGRHARRRGSSTTTTPAPPASRRRTTFPTRRSSTTPSSRRCARARIAPWRRRRTTSRAKATWTSSRTRSGWIRSRFA